MDKKYQVFLSSTYEDLKEERAEVIKAMLSRNYIPVGMEYFPAADDDQMTIIKELIDNCDYYVLILGGRYGSIEPKSEKSYTQLEYEYAVKKEVPISAFYFKNKDDLAVFKTDNNQKKAKKLISFKKLVKSKSSCKSWSNADNLALKVSQSLDYQIKHKLRTGWIRADTITPDEANSEILKLQENNEKQIKDINFLTSKYPKGNYKFMQGNDAFTIHYTRVFEENSYGIITLSWNDIFITICTLLLKPVSEDNIKHILEGALLPPFSSINKDDFQTIIIQLMTLKLINTENTQDHGVLTYWSLTQFGRSKMIKLKAIKR